MTVVGLFYFCLVLSWLCQEVISGKVTVFEKLKLQRMKIFYLFASK